MAWDSAVCPVLAAAGFKDVEVFGPHAAPDADFPNVPSHVANPENAAVFDAIIDRGKQIGADLILATDPDCDRLGCAAPLTPAADAAWGTMTGNQIGSLLTDYLLAPQSGGHAVPGFMSSRRWSPPTDAPHRRRLRCAVGRNLLVGFKYIGGAMDDAGRGICLRGRGILRFSGRQPRPRQGRRGGLDAVGGVGRRLKAKGKHLHEQLDALLRRYGFHSEGRFFRADARRPGDGEMKALMAGFARSRRAIGRLEVARVHDYLQRHGRRARRQAGAAGRAQGDMVMFDLEADGQLRGGTSLGHGAQGEVLHVCLRPPEATVELAASRPPRRPG